MLSDVRPNTSVLILTLQACGDYNGKLAIYDLERNDVAVWSANAHKSIINAVDGLGGPESTYGAPELVSWRTVVDLAFLPAPPRSVFECLRARRCMPHSTTLIFYRLC